jgi:hypothetical protein
VIERDEPLVAVVCVVPLLGEALCAALAGMAECKTIPAREPDLSGLLRSLQPDAIVVDDEEEAQATALYSRFARVPVVHVCRNSHQVRVLEDGRWVTANGLEATPESVRNLVAGKIYGRKGPR